MLSAKLCCTAKNMLFCLLRGGSNTTALTTQTSDQKHAAVFPLLWENEESWGFGTNFAPQEFSFWESFWVTVNRIFIDTFSLSLTFSKTGKYLLVALSLIESIFFCFASGGEKGNIKIMCIRSAIPSTYMSILWEMENSWNNFSKWLKQLLEVTTIVPIFTAKTKHKLELQILKGLKAYLWSSTLAAVVKSQAKTMTVNKTPPSTFSCLCTGLTGLNVVHNAAIK